jgi:hypothetical protein
MRTSLAIGALALLALTSSGCLIDDTGRPKGQSGGPSASVPNSGGPARRESAAKTLKDAEPPAPADSDSGTLETEQTR